MPNRMIRDSARVSPSLALLSGDEERLFWRLILVADDHGRFEAAPQTVRSLCFPAHTSPKMTPVTVGKWLATLDRLGLIQLYAVEGRPFGHFPKWGVHQRVRESKPKHPGPDDPAAVRGELPQLAADCRLAVVGAVDVAEDEAVSVRPHAASDGFHAFWLEYPSRHGRKEGKAEAQAEWYRLKPSPDLQAAMLAAVVRYAKSTDLPVDAVRWLKRRRWEDEVPPPKEDPMKVLERRIAERRAAKGATG